MRFNGEIVTKPFKGINWQQMTKLTKNYGFEDNLTLWDCLPLPQGYKTMYMTIIFNIFLSDTVWSIKANIHVALYWQGATNKYVFFPVG